MISNEITRKLFYANPYQKEVEAKVISIENNEVVLDQTCFYPEGGGQVGDSGKINGIKVIDTIKRGTELLDIGDGMQIHAGGEIRHVLESAPNFSVGDTVRGSIDWDRRYKIMKLHSASHIMEYFLFQVFGKTERIGTTVDDKKDRSDYRSEERLDPEKLKKVEDLCNEFISKNQEIKTFSREENVNIRVWVSGDIKVSCGGTHPQNTEEIGKIKLKRANPGSGRERVETYLVSE